MPEPQSPCTGVCRIEPATGLCLGCRRTLCEIADWPMLSRKDRFRLLEKLKSRGS